jgi:D-cysteine desulfhydrase/L-cysteate sulfo-lyase
MTKVADINDTANAFGRLSRLPRFRLAHENTPIEELPRLSDKLGGARVFVKRDDCTGLAFGGNKIRQLEYYIGEAQAEGADTVLITGAVQSNFVRSAAAAACKAGMACHIQLEERVGINSDAYRNSGNVLLDRMFGATLHSYPEGEDEAGADRQINEIAAELKTAGRKPYVIPLALNHPPLGALGYIHAAQEIVAWTHKQDWDFDEVFVASGSGSTHSGLLFGLRAAGSTVPVMGVCVRRDGESQQHRIETRCSDIAKLLEAPQAVKTGDVRIDDTFLAPGYGKLNDAAARALKLSAQLEALLLDPVYTAKTMACALARAERLTPDKRILMIHTGGNPALFGYQEQVADVFGG